MSSVRISGVSKTFGSRRALDRVDLVVPDGSLTTVLGPSGCGKTTLLRIIAGFVAADAGTVQIGDRVVEGGTLPTPPERRGVGYVPQEGALFPHLDVRANILFGLPRRQRTARRLGELLELAELSADVVSMTPHQLSGGQQQRVALARALAPRPRVIVLDEPFSSLDATLRASAGRTVRRVLEHAGATALLVTHDQGEALSLGDAVAVMRAGRVVQVDTPARLYEHPHDPNTGSFVGGATLLPGVVGHGRATTALGSMPTEGPDGPATILIRPERIEVTHEGSGVAATVTEVSYYGAQVVVHLILADGTPVTARGSSVHTPQPGDRVGLRVDGPVIAFQDGSAP